MDVHLIVVDANVVVRFLLFFVREVQNNKKKTAAHLSPDNKKLNLKPPPVCM
jgi:hypothetical protein